MMNPGEFTDIEEGGSLGAHLELQGGIQATLRQLTLLTGGCETPALPAVNLDWTFRICF